MSSEENERSADQMDGQRNYPMFGQLVYAFGARSFLYIVCYKWMCLYVCLYCLGMVEWIGRFINQ